MTDTNKNLSQKIKSLEDKCNEFESIIKTKDEEISSLNISINDTKESHKKEIGNIESEKIKSLNVEIDELNKNKRVGPDPAQFNG